MTRNKFYIQRAIIANEIREKTGRYINLNNTGSYRFYMYDKNDQVIIKFESDWVYDLFMNRQIGWFSTLKCIELEVPHETSVSFRVYTVRFLVQYWLHLIDRMKKNQISGLAPTRLIISLYLTSLDWAIYWIRNFVYLCWPIRWRSREMIRRLEANPAIWIFSFGRL